MCDEDLSGLLAQVTDFSLEELDLLARPTPSHFEQSIDDRIQINVILIRHGVFPDWDAMIG